MLSLNTGITVRKGKGLKGTSETFSFIIEMVITNLPTKFYLKLNAAILRNIPLIFKINNICVYSYQTISKETLKDTIPNKIVSKHKILRDKLKYMCAKTLH